MEQRLHNKSFSSVLSILHKHPDDEVLEGYYYTLLGELRAINGLIEDSPCLVMNCGDGRLSSYSTKIFWGYQLIAWKKFGRETLLNVRPSKTNDDLTISHLCGTRNCCEADHIVIEPKSVNDTRTHCHYIMKTAKEEYMTSDKVRQFLEQGFCPHEPRCCTIDIYNYCCGI